MANVLCVTPPVRRAAIITVGCGEKDAAEPVIDHLTNGGPVNGAEMADVGRTVFPPQSNKPRDEPTSGNNALASSEHISTESQPNKPGQQREPAEPEMLVPTRGPDGIRRVPLPKR